MTFQEMMFFSGSVLGPALAAQEMQRLLSAIPELRPEPRLSRQTMSVDDMLASVFDTEAGPA